MKSKNIKIIFAWAFFIVAILALLVEIALFSGAFRSRVRDRNNSSVFVLYHKEIIAKNPQQIEAALLERPKFIERAKRIRESIRPISLENKEIIQKMLKQTSDDPVLYDLLMKKLPRIPPPLFFQYNRGGPSDPLAFSWDVIDPFEHDNQNSPEVIQNKERLRFLKMSKFKAFHDYPISISASGVNTFVVWVSGRITETYQWENRSTSTPFITPEEVTGTKNLNQKSTFEGEIITVMEPFEFYR